MAVYFSEQLYRQRIPNQRFPKFVSQALCYSESRARGPLRSGNSRYSSSAEFSDRAVDSSSIGTMISASLFFGLFTRAVIGHALIGSAGYGTKSPFRFHQLTKIDMLFR
jgi:hypothetical protein